MIIAYRSIRSSRITRDPWITPGSPQNPSDGFFWISIHDPAGWILGCGRIPNTVAMDLDAQEVVELTEILHLIFCLQLRLDVFVSVDQFRKREGWKRSQDMQKVEKESLFFRTLSSLCGSSQVLKLSRRATILFLSYST